MKPLKSSECLREMKLKPGEFVTFEPKCAETWLSDASRGDRLNIAIISSCSRSF